MLACGFWMVANHFWVDTAQEPEFPLSRSVLAGEQQANDKPQACLTNNQEKHASLQENDTQMHRTN